MPGCCGGGMCSHANPRLFVEKAPVGKSPIVNQPQVPKSKQSRCLQSLAGFFRSFASCFNSNTGKSS